MQKSFKDRVVLDGIDLEAPAGSVFALLGPNGAGKTTTVNVLTTLIGADGGTVRVAGHDVATEAKAVRAAIGVTESLRTLLNRLDELALHAEEFAVRTPDLDDVFLALTGHSSAEVTTK